MATITIDGVELPSPYRGLNFIQETMVNSGRNANGVVVGEKVGRMNYKIDALEWRDVSAELCSRILLPFYNKFFVTAKIPDPVHNRFITIKMYPGNSEEHPLTGWVDANGLPTRYEYVKINLIDCGVVNDV